MNPILKLLLGIVAHVPILAVFALAFWMTGIAIDTAPQPRIGGELSDEAATFLIGTVGIALFQMVSAVGLIVHAAFNHRLAVGMRVLWSILVVLVGSLMQPLYYWLYVFTDKGQPQVPVMPQHPPQPPYGYGYPPPQQPWRPM